MEVSVQIPLTETHLTMGLFYFIFFSLFSPMIKSIHTHNLRNQQSGHITRHACKIETQTLPLLTVLFDPSPSISCATPPHISRVFTLNSSIFGADVDSSSSSSYFACKCSASCSDSSTVSGGSTCKINSTFDTVSS